MSGEKRVKYEMANFPWERFAVGWGEKGADMSNFGTGHQHTYVANEKDASVLEDYAVHLGLVEADSLSLYIDPEGNNVMNPSLYLYPHLHPDWEKKDADGAPTLDPNGVAIQAFFEKLRAVALERQQALPAKEQAKIMGAKLAKDDCERWIAPVCRHPLFSKDHKISPGMEDEERSPTFKCAAWSQDETKRKERDGFVKKRAPSSKPKADDGTLRIPNTNTLIYTAFYIVPLDKPPSEEMGRRVTNWARIKPFVYHRDNENASQRRMTLLLDLWILGPSIVWKPGKNETGELQIKINDCRFKSWKADPRSQGLAIEAIHATKANDAALLARFGAPQVLDEEPEQEKKRARPATALDAEDEPAQKRRKPSDEEHGSEETTNDEEREAFEEQKRLGLF